MSVMLVGGGTGGHVYPMIAVADALRRLVPGIPLVFVGTARGIETEVVPRHGYPLELVNIQPIRGGGLGFALRGVLRAAGSIPEARALVQKHAPRVVFSLGGYAAGSASVAAKLAGVPLALMEPNSEAGLANKLVARLVQRAYTAFPETDAVFPFGVVLRSGVAIREGFAPRPYPELVPPFRILILGGSQGAEALNEALPAALAGLEAPVEVTHQAGRGKDEALRRRYAALGLARVEVTPFISDMPAALGRAHLVVGRAGAGALSETCAIGRPSLLIPYPFAAGDHQRKNALSLQEGGAAVCVVASEATSERLGDELRALLSTPARLSTMARAATALGRPDAAIVVARDLLQLGGIEVAPMDDVARGAGSEGGAGQVCAGEVV